jgi:mycofactocin biosynthesis protein MftB
VSTNPEGCGQPAPPRFDLDRPWRIDDRVAVRPEPFGALLYHFGTRRLSFLKNATVLTVVRSLAEHPSARAACAAAGVTAAALPAYERALATLAESHMIRPTARPESTES